MTLFLLLAVLAGAGLAFQAVINTRLSLALGSPLWATVVQVLIGLLLLAVWLGVARQPLPSFAGAARLPLWVWTGGLLGTAYVVTVIVVTRPLGAALMVASVIVGQVVAAMIIDHYGWFGAPVHRMSMLRVVGALLVLLGVVLVRR
jgi:transporter family-2 protein